MTQFGSLYDALGRELSVITKGSARFEGTLTSFSLQDSTITLENVWCLGTENRQVEQTITPSPNPVPSITFDGLSLSSIKVLNPECHMNQDPAIVSIIPNSQVSIRPPKRQINNSVMSLFGVGGPRQRRVDVNLLMKEAASNGNSSIKGNQRKQNGSPQKQVNRNKNQNAHRNGNQNQHRSQRRAASGSGKNKKQIQARNANKNSRHVSFTTESLSAGSSNRGNRQFTRIPQIPAHLNRRQADRTPNSPSRTQRRQPVGKFQVSENSTKLYTDDFDFDQAHEKFKELSIKDDRAKGDAKDDGKDNTNSDSIHDLKEPVYNQDKSFYDNLSMTTETEGHQRLTRRQMMQANKETFGITYLPGRRSFFRGSYSRGNRRQFQRMAMAH